MKFYSITNDNPGFGNDPIFLGFSHVPVTLQTSEEVSEKAIQEYIKYNGQPKWFSCCKCKAELKNPLLRPFSCQNCGHTNVLK